MINAQILRRPRFLFPPRCVETEAILAVNKEWTSEDFLITVPLPVQKWAEAHWNEGSMMSSMSSAAWSS